jgi:hypothetical protein
MNTAEERQWKQCKHQQWYQEQNHDTLLELCPVVNMNEIHLEQA